MSATEGDQLRDSDGFFPAKMPKDGFPSAQQIGIFRYEKKKHWDFPKNPSISQVIRPFVGAVEVSPFRGWPFDDATATGCSKICLRQRGAMDGHQSSGGHRL